MGKDRESKWGFACKKRGKGDSSVQVQLQEKLSFFITNKKGKGKKKRKKDCGRETGWMVDERKREQLDEKGGKRKFQRKGILK